MTELIAKNLVRVGPTPDQSRCEIVVEEPNGEPGTLTFPAEQLQMLVSLLLQMERQEFQQSESAKAILKPSGVQVAVAQNNASVLLNFRVAEMHFAFSLPREQAVELAQIIQTKLPAH